MNIFLEIYIVYCLMFIVTKIITEFDIVHLLIVLSFSYKNLFPINHKEI